MATVDLQEDMIAIDDDGRSCCCSFARATNEKVMQAERHHLLELVSFMSL